MTIRLKIANNVAIIPGRVKATFVSKPPNKGPIIKPKPKAAPIRPNVLARFSGVDISARIAVALAAVPPLAPSIILAVNSNAMIRGVPPFHKDALAFQKPIVIANKEIPAIRLSMDAVEEAVLKMENLIIKP